MLTRKDVGEIVFVDVRRTKLRLAAVSEIKCATSRACGNNGTTNEISLPPSECDEEEEIEGLAPEGVG